MSHLESADKTHVSRGPGLTLHWARVSQFQLLWLTIPIPLPHSLTNASQNFLYMTQFFLADNISWHIQRVTSPQSYRDPAYVYQYYLPTLSHVGSFLK